LKKNKRMIFHGYQSTKGGTNPLECMAIFCFHGKVIDILVDDRIQQESHLSAVAVRQGGHVWNSGVGHASTGKRHKATSEWMTQKC
jgi:hypothetical protein